MVQFRPFRCKLRNALQHTHLQSAVREGYAEKYAFEFAVCLLVFLRLADAFLQFLALYLLVALVHKSVMFGFEVGGADVLRAVRVLAEKPQEVYGVTPVKAIGKHINNALNKEMCKKCTFQILTGRFSFIVWR